MPRARKTSKKKVWQAKGGDVGLLRLAFKMVKVAFMCRVSGSLISTWQNWIDEVMRAKNMYEQCTFAGGFVTMINGWLNPACSVAMSKVRFITEADAAWAELQQNMGIPGLLDKCQLIIYVVCVLKALRHLHTFIHEFMKTGTDEEIVQNISSIQQPMTNEALQQAIQAALLTIVARRRSQDPSPERAYGAFIPQVQVIDNDMDMPGTPRALSEIAARQELLFKRIDNVADSQSTEYFEAFSQMPESQSGGRLRP